MKQQSRTACLARPRCLFGVWHTFHDKSSMHNLIGCCSNTFYEVQQPKEKPFADDVDNVTEQGLNFPINSSKGCANVGTGVDFARTTTARKLRSVSFNAFMHYLDIIVFTGRGRRFYEQSTGWKPLELIPKIPSWRKRSRRDRGWVRKERLISS